MKSLPLLFVFTALAPRAAAPDTDLRAVATEGVALRKSFRERTTWTLQSIAQQLDGIPVSQPLPRMNCSYARDLEVVDTYAQVSEGLATILQREYQSVAGRNTVDFEVQGLTNALEFELQSGLEGAHVVFERSDKGAAPVARFRDEGAGDTQLLPGLREDLDLRAFANGEDVGEGDWWRVDAATLADVLAPGGELMLAPPDGELDPDELTLLDATDVVATTLCGLAECIGELSGEVLCTWKETRTEDQREIALIELDWESSARSDVSEVLRRRMRAAGLSTGRDELSVLVSVASEGEGELSWDLAAGRALSLKLALTSRIDVQISYEDPGGTAAMECGIDADSTIEATFEVE